MSDKVRLNPFEPIETRLESIESTLVEIQMAITGAQIAEKKYYSVLEAAEQLNVAPLTLYRNIKSGKIPAKKIGSRIMVPGSYVDKP